MTVVLQNEDQVLQAIDAGTVKAGVVIPHDFSEQVLRGKGSVLMLLDGSDSFSVVSGYNAALSIAQKYSLNLAAEVVQNRRFAAGFESAGRGAADLHRHARAV